MLFHFVEIVHRQISDGVGIFFPKGFVFLKNEETNTYLRGIWTDEKIVDSSQLNKGVKGGATKISSYLQIKAKSPAPSNKKEKGILKKDGKFIKNKE